MALSSFPFFQTSHWSDDLFRMLDETMAGSMARRGAGVFPTVNIYDDGQSYLVRAEVPGLSKESIEVSVKNDQLTLRGERQVSVAGAQANYHRREREGGQFRRVVTLPHPVDSENIRASYKNGVLEIEIPRLPQARERKIEIH